MNIIRNTFIVFFFIIISHLYSQDIPETAVHNSTVFTGLKPINCTKKESGKTDDILFKALPSIPYIVLRDKKSTNKTVKDNGLPESCPDNVCAGKYADAIPAQRVIYGSIRKIEDDKEKLMGDEGKYKYLLHMKTDVTYDITVILYDHPSKKKLTEIRTKFRESRLSNAADYIIKKLKPYYKVEIKPPPPPPEPPPESTPVKEEKKLTTFLSIEPQFMFPKGELAKLSGFGPGLLLNAGIEIPGSNISTGIRLSYNYFFPEADYANKYMINTLGLNISYDHRINQFSIVPVLSGGYIAHYLEKASGGGLRTYLDPFIQAGLNLHYHAGESFSLYAGPGYILFFEEIQKGSILQINAGINIRFADR